MDSKEANHVAEKLKPCPKVEAKINGHPATLEVDTGSVVTLINEDIWRNSIDTPTLRPASLELKSYSHGNVPLLGEFDGSVEINGQRTEFCARKEKPGISREEIYCVKSALIDSRFLLFSFQRKRS